jgi:hypothetical protein
LNSEPSKTTVKLPHSVIVRAPGLMPMLYKPSELAEHLGILSRTIRQWVSKGLPHQRDARGHLWINGEELARWVEVQRSLKRGPKLKADEAYCVRCRRAVKLIAPARNTNGKRTLLQGKCPQCGASVNKGVRDGEPT